MIASALKLRQQFGDDAFFRALNESKVDDGWGDAVRWDEHSFEAAAKADPRSRDRSELIGALAQSLMPGARHYGQHRRSGYRPRSHQPARQVAGI